MAHMGLNVKEKAEVLKQSLAPPPVEKILCEICNSEMIERHCKIVCLNCGFMWDCSDH